MAHGRFRQFYQRWSSLSLSQEEKLRLVALGLEHRIDRYTESLDGSIDRLSASIIGKLGDIVIRRRGSSTPATDNRAVCSSPTGRGEVSAEQGRRGGIVELRRSEPPIEYGYAMVGVGVSGLPPDFAAFTKERQDRLWGW